MEYGDHWHSFVNKHNFKNNKISGLSWCIFLSNPWDIIASPIIEWDTDSSLTCRWIRMEFTTVVEQLKHHCQVANNISCSVKLFQSLTHILFLTYILQSMNRRLLFSGQILHAANRFTLVEYTLYREDEIMRVLPNFSFYRLCRPISYLAKCEDMRYLPFLIWN